MTISNYFRNRRAETALCDFQPRTCNAIPSHPGSVTQRVLQCASINSAITAILLLLHFNSLASSSAPEVLSVEKVRKELSSTENISVSGIAFYQNKLYAGSGPGLLEISNGVVKTIYRWDKATTSVIFPSHDTANELLWSQVSGRHQLVCYDGKTWRTVDRPKPKQGYVSRGDAWEGFRCVSSRKSFYFQGGGHAWVWRGSKWIEQENPPTKTNEKNLLGLLDRLIVTDDHCYFVMRDEREPFRSWLEVRKSIGVADRFNGNFVYYFAHTNWNSVTNSTSVHFLSEETVAVDHRGYIRSTEGELLEVTEAGIIRLTTPGVCEAIAESATGTLLASFSGQGVYELREQWHKLLSTPYPDSKENYRVCLAASGQQIALSISTRMPVTNPLIAIWIANGQKWRQVEFTY